MAIVVTFSIVMSTASTTLMPFFFLEFTMFFRLGPLALPLLALSAACTPVAAGPEAPGSQPGALAPLTKAAFSEELTERTFRYFWATTDPEQCLAPDRWPSHPFSSIAATGFAPPAYGLAPAPGHVTPAPDRLP